jgi:hypothetical protein
MPSHPRSQSVSSWEHYTRQCLELWDIAFLKRRLHMKISLLPYLAQGVSFWCICRIWEHRCIRSTPSSSIWSRRSCPWQTVGRARGLALGCNHTETQYCTMLHSIRAPANNSRHIGERESSHQFLLPNLLLHVFQNAALGESRRSGNSIKL